ncbi:heme exporter protein CcmB [Cronobacter sakazakii]|uniref:Heme exporter protein B n=1 Tax=Cronobacter malonaticus TaxID=413503 RepID=A0A423Y1E0_9ENTR|nr:MULTISPECIES: heme exporter protein CcmB [Cronobacter]EKK3978250.1 heme exporter protein CcmB [Cronobacter sakazakii]EKY1980588.1 heme exporter protein CcmB [Cronobacter sakazakii]EKY1999619.1 heme exporter protein CcmB [Cronobacter sakazakii]ELY3756428.1 heme exporter protein CcmB [Cronobacter sakazakii]ELY4375358.1 heme exporter protein CcmB [Cronobacter sakazakii]
MMGRIIRRELRLAARHQAELLNPLWFFLVVIVLFALGAGPEPQLLARIAPGVVWVAALLASLLAMDRLFRDDARDGALEQLMLLPTPLPVVVIAKVTAHWVATGLPLVVLSPLAALLMGLNGHATVTLMLTLLLGTPTLSFFGALGAALTAGLRRGGILLSLIILPLAIPLLIFSTAAVDAAVMQLPVGGFFALSGAFLTASVTLMPFATAAALRITIQ